MVWIVRVVKTVNIKDSRVGLWNLWTKIGNLFEADPGSSRRHYEMENLELDPQLYS